MSAADSFISFHALPLELRLQIWGEALSVRSVWGAIHNYNAGRDLSANRLPFIMVYVGPAPYLAGLSSREARRLMEQSYVKPIRGLFSGLATSAGFYWVDLDRTVVYLGDSSDEMTVLNSFGADELSKFKHVALPWYQFGRLARTCQRLATICPALRTIIIQRSETEAATNRLLRQPMSLETAAYYASIPEYTGPELGYEELDAPHFRSLLLEYLAIRLSGYICCFQTLLTARHRLETAAADVIRIFKGISDYSNVRVAIIGGLALWKYIPTGKTIESPYMPAAAVKLRDLPAGAIPYISAIDLVVFKMNSCGLRVQASKKRTDADDAQALLERLTVHASLNLTDAQLAIVEPYIKDVVAHGTKTEAWWRERVGLPASW